MYTMQAVINLLIESKFINAIKEYRNLTGCSLREAKDAVEAIRPYVDSTCPYPPVTPVKIGRSLGDILQEGLDKAKQTKPLINKWMVTGNDPQTSRDWNDWRDSKEAALALAQDAINQKYTYVRISEVIAEAYTKTTWTIDL